MIGLAFESQPAGSAVTLADSSGNVLLEWTSPKAFSSLVISLPSLAQGQSYTLTAGNYSQEISMESLSYNGLGGGHGGMPGGFGGGKDMPQDGGFGGNMAQPPDRAFDGDRTAPPENGSGEAGARPPEGDFNPAESAGNQNGQSSENDTEYGSVSSA